MKQALLTGTVEKLGWSKFRAFVHLNLACVPHTVCVWFLHGTRALLYILLSKPCHYFLSTALFFTMSSAYSQLFSHLHAMFFFYPECEQHSVGCKICLEGKWTLHYFCLNNQVFFLCALNCPLVCLCCLLLMFLFRRKVPPLQIDWSRYILLFLSTLYY